MSVGNEQNMAQIREAMANQTADQVRQGGDLEHAVPIDYTSYFGNKFVGTVVFKKPNMADYMKMGGIKSEYLRLGGVQDIKLVDESVKFMAHVLATLSVVLVKRPEWLLDLAKVEEPDVLYHIFDKFEEWENSFRKSVQGTTTPDSQASEGAEAVGTP